MADALKFAKEAHKGQVRKGGEPYIHHPVRVAAYARLYVHHVALFLPAAYLHDTLENCPDITYNILKDKFGVMVANIVLELTDEFTKKKYSNFKRRERKQKEHERLANCQPISQQLKLCDRLDNISNKLLFMDSNESTIYIRETYDLLEKIGNVNKELTSIIKDRLNGYTQAYPPCRKN